MVDDLADVLFGGLDDIAVVGHGGVDTLPMCRFAGWEIARDHEQPTASPTIESC